jgi:ABC-type transport system involved in multi-copper enzyme maturation permease subunit
VVASTVGLLYHAVRDRDLQIRRLYGTFGLLLLAGGLFFTLTPFQAGFGTYFISSAFPLLALAGMFLVAFVRNESETGLARGGLALLAFMAVAMAGTGLVGGNISGAFLSPHGLLLTLLGLGYLWGVIEQLPEEDRLRSRIGWAMEIASYLVLAVVLVRSFVLPWLFTAGWLSSRPDMNYFASSGALLIGVAVLYLAIAYLVASDLQVVVITRRELMAFFYSPTVYFVLLAASVIAGLQYFLFVGSLTQGRLEPIVSSYIIGLFPAFTMILIVPVLTMRLLSEEYNSATMEVMFTGPVGEWSVVIGKLLAVLVVFLLTWLPYGLYLIALRVELGRDFDYRPLVSFVIGLVCSGSAFLSMGLFFSSLTRSQIIAAILSAMGMVALFATYSGFLGMATIGASVQSFLVNFSFIDLWIDNLQGRVVWVRLLSFLSMAVFWLFLTVKVVESRKWR